MGFGGSCFPKDVKALIKTAQAHGYAPELIAAVDAVNQRQKGTLARKIEAFFRSQGGLAGRTLGLWGLAFKANTDDIRESPALELVRLLTAAGMRVKAFDPAAANRARAVLRDNPLVEVSEQQYDVVDAADALAVATDWNQFRNPDFPRIQRMLKIPVIFDGRNLYDPDIVAGYGLAYVSIGRAAAGSALPPESAESLQDIPSRAER